MKTKKLLATVILSSLFLSGYSSAGFQLPQPERYVELNHALTDGMITYPGESMVKHLNPQPRYPNGSLVDGLAVLGISGTYIDSPHHVDEKLGNISAYPLSSLVNLPITVVTLRKNARVFEIEDFENTDVNGKAVLLFTGQDRKFGQPDYMEESPYLSGAAASWLVKHGAKLVGIDSVLIDNPNAPDAAVPAHNILLKNGVVVAEDMTNIKNVVGTQAYLTAVPPRTPTTSFPARIFAAVYK
ncbi:cyclase family protein [Candidatus Pantoea bituminis]|uniref:cyclase family protein n=1 Tax=Candidatus Pantoea bituminis TaxID=2831036 RepID=UPI001C05F752|nr:cyclase family protein [Pantoea bituminis]